MSESHKAVLQQAIDTIEETVKILGATQAKKFYEVYKQCDSILTVAMDEILAKHRKVIEDAFEKPVQPACYQYLSTDGTWKNFVDDKHRDNTMEDKRWSIRALYTSPQVDQPVHPAVQKVAEQDTKKGPSNIFREGCTECAREKKSRADNKEWQDGIKRGNEIISILARANAAQTGSGK